MIPSLPPVSWTTTRIFSFGFAPRGWATCNGQLMPINQNQALFSVLGTTFGGNGTTTFALPNLQGRVPMHTSTAYPLGDAGGEDAHHLTTAEMPGHTHQVNASAARATAHNVVGNVWAATSTNQYATGTYIEHAAGAHGKHTAYLDSASVARKFGSGTFERSAFAQRSAATEERETEAVNFNP